MIIKPITANPTSCQVSKCLEISIVLAGGWSTGTAANAAGVAVIMGIGVELTPASFVNATTRDM